MVESTRIHGIVHDSVGLTHLTARFDATEALSIEPNTLVSPAYHDYLAGATETEIRRREIRNNEINYIQKLILSKCLVKTNLEGHPVLRFIAFSFLVCLKAYIWLPGGHVVSPRRYKYQGRWTRSWHLLSNSQLSL